MGFGIPKDWLVLSIGIGNYKKAHIGGHYSMQTTLRLEKSPAFWEMTLVAPDGKPPTLDFQVLSEMEKALKEIEASIGASGERAPSCIVVGSSSPKCFCAGANINVLDTLSEETMPDWISRGHATLNRIEDLPIPVIAKVQGYALGGGLELALACDLIVCDETAKLGLTEANIGFVPGWGGSFRLPRRVSSAKAKRLFYAAEIVDGESALSIGLVDELVEGSRLDDWLSEFSRTLSNKSSVGIRGFKRILNDQDQAAREANLRAEIDHSLSCIENSDTKRRIREFLEKRKK